jgi:hypothetical protein
MNRSDPNQPAPDPLENAMKAMRSVETSSVPQQVVERTRLAVTQSVRQRRWRTHTLQGAAAAASLLALLGVTGVFTSAGPSVAMAEVLQQVEATKTMRARISTPSGERGEIFVSDSHVRSDTEYLVIITDLKTQHQLRLNKQTKTAYQLAQPAVAMPADVYGLLRKLASSASRPAEEYVDKQNRRFPGFTGKSEMPIDAKTKTIVDVNIWIDPATKLPVRMETVPLEDVGEAMLFDELEFDVPLDDSVFDMSVPKGYTVVTLGSAAELNPPPNE